MRNFCFTTHIRTLKKSGVWVVFFTGFSSCALFQPVLPPPTVSNESVFMNEYEVDTMVREVRQPFVPKWKQRSGESSGAMGAASNLSFRYEVLKEAEKYLGIPYTWAGKTPLTGFDCSGFTSFVLGKFDYRISPSSKDQANAGVSIPLELGKPGDLIIFRNEKNQVFHVSFITDIQPQVIEVIHSVSGGVKKENLFHSSWWMSKKMEVRSILP